MCVWSDIRFALLAIVIWPKKVHLAEIVLYTIIAEAKCGMG